MDDSRLRHGMDRVLAVAVREYLATVRTKAFVIALVMMPLLTIGAILIPLLATQLGGDAPRNIAIVDETAILFDELSARLQRSKARAASQELEGPESLASDPAATLELVDAGNSGDERHLLELSDRIRQGELFAVVVIPEAVMDPDAGAAPFYASNTPTSAGARRWLSWAIEASVHEARLRQLEVDVESILAAQTPVELEDGRLVVRSGDEVAEGPAPNPLRDVLLPIIAAMLVFMSLMLGATPLMQSTLEEKMQRIVEVIVSSVTPLSLMLGKLLGAALVSYTILALYGVGGLLVAANAGALDLLSPIDFLVIGGFQAVAFVMYGSFFLAVGSACNDLKETQSLMMPVLMLITTPLLLLQLVLDEPNGTASTALSFFPFFTPPLMMLRHLVSPGAPLWQVSAGFAASAATAVMCLLASARVFRIGLLMQGSAPSFRQLYRWLVKG
jgi:ABC-2 type transport system permease protein